MLCEVPLTDEQRDYAAEHHALVYKFLKDNHLPMDEFYDVVIFGYLRAVRRYLTEPALRQYKFTTIAMRVGTDQRAGTLCVYGPGVGRNQF